MLEKKTTTPATSANTARWLSSLAERAGILLLSCLFAAGCNSGRNASPNSDFDQGRSLVVAGKYAEAIPVLRRYLKEDPQGKHASRAGLFLGKAHLALGDIEAARQAFDDTHRNYPDSLESHKSKYKLAMISLLSGDRQDALERFQQLAQAPDGPLAAEATAMAEFLRQQPAAE